MNKNAQRDGNTCIHSYTVKRRRFISIFPIKLWKKKHNYHRHQRKLNYVWIQSACEGKCD